MRRYRLDPAVSHFTSGYFILVICLLFLFGPANAQSDDITLTGDVSPVYFLEKSFSETVVASGGESLTLIVSDIFSEEKRILLRFYLPDIDQRWAAFITDDSRLYGSYLPIAELVFDGGSFRTPSSASRFSFLEYNGKNIIGGLLVFDTDKAEQSFYVNFNQIPFDTQPLSEGFTRAVVLSSAPKNNKPEPSAGKAYVHSREDLEFSIAASAQTSGLTMIQPAVRMLRDDEILSKFGWIMFADSGDGKRFGVTRGNLYGFNLADDTEYSPAHAYVFSPLNSSDPVNIWMDHAYVVRSYDPVQTANLDLTGKEKTVILSDDDFHLTLSGVRINDDENYIRLFIDTGDQRISDISFRFTSIPGIIQPSVICGMETQSGQFACDVFFDDISFPVNSLSVEVDAIEYYKAGPWEITWTPVPMESADSGETNADYENFPFTYDHPNSKIQPENIQKILNGLDRLDQDLTKSPGWIRESYELFYQYSAEEGNSLIPSDQFDQYFTRYISESWYLIDDSGHVQEKSLLVRDPENEKIYSAQWYKSGNILDLIHSLYVKTNQPIETNYRCFEDFRNIAESSAVLLSADPCADDRSENCLNFYQSLNGMPNSAGSQSISFRIAAGDSFIRRMMIDYDYGALKLEKDTIALEKRDSLPDIILSLMDSVK